MPQVIYFRLGEHDDISLVSLLTTLRDVKGLLSDFDAALSQDPRGNIKWNVEVLQKNSPPLLGLSGEVGRSSRARVPEDFPERVSRTLLNSTAKLSLQSERLDIVSDSAMERYTRLASRSRRIGEIEVSTETQKVPINETTLSHIRTLSGPRSQSTGSVLGRLDTISVHNANEIRVWDENTNRPVRCRYPDALEETVKALLRERVLVSGVVSFNEHGRPISVKVSALTPYGRPEELPTIEQMSGLIDDVTGGASLKEYMEHLRDG
jgi:hypothetical protein